MNEPTDIPPPPPPAKNPALGSRIGCSLTVLVLAVLVAFGLFASRSKPGAAETRETSLVVRLQTAVPTHVDVRIEAYGEARALRVAELAPEVSGLVMELPRPWREGDRVAQGQVLLRLDPRDYQAAVDEARAQVAQAEAQLALLAVQHASDTARLPWAERTRDLTRAEFGRVKNLYESGQIGSASGVESSEQAYNQAETQWILARQAIELHPARMKEAEANLQAATARLDRARTALERCELTAPFDGRITHAQVEIGQFVPAGRHVLSLADDRELELRVPVDAADLRQWIPFETSGAPDAWFPPLPPLPVELAWTESQHELAWTGTLHRVAAFDPTTRTASLAVRISAGQARAPGHPIPLSAGMFLRARLPGRTMRDVFALPRAAVTFDGQAYLSESNTLRTVRVNVLRVEGDTVYVDQGLREGDQVIVTRLVAPLEGSRLTPLEN